MIKRATQDFSVLNLLGSLENTPERFVLRKNSGATSARHFLAKISSLRASLRAVLSTGDIVAISGERSEDAVAMALACWAEGFVPLPVDFRQDMAIICQILDSVRPKGCFLGELLDVHAIQSRVQYLRWKAVAGRTADGCVCTDSLAETTVSSGVTQENPPESAILHSAGVCGTPHTVRHEQRALSTQRKAATVRFGLRSNDVVFFTGTLASPAAFSLVFAGALMEGACISLDDPTKVTTPISVQDSERPVVLFAEVADHSLSAEQLLLLKGAKSVILSDAPATDERVGLIQRATDAQVYCAYCCAEACGFLCVNASPGLWPADAAGIPVPNVEIAVLDAKSRPADDTSLGKIAFRFSDSESVQWSQTGDWGRFDENGLLHVVGCQRSVIHKAGFPIFARDVEDVLRPIAGVKDAWVFGIPDREVGEEVTAQIAISDPSLKIESLLEKVTEKLPAYMIPHEPLFVQELPATPSGKKVRRTSRVASSSNAARATALPGERGPNLAQVTEHADQGSAIRTES